MLWEDEFLLTDSDWSIDAALVFFRRTRIAITVIEMNVVKRMITVRTPIETPNMRPLTVNELEAPVTIST